MSYQSSALTSLLMSALPPELAAFIQAHVLDPSSPLQSIKRQGLIYAYQAANTAYPLVEPLIERAASALTGGGNGAEHAGGLAGFLGLLAALMAVVLFLSWLHRLVMWWTRLAMRAVWWGFVAAAVAWCWQRGPLEAARDVVVVVGKMAGFAAAVKGVWLEEYRRYEQQQTQGYGGGQMGGSRYRGR